MKRDRETKVTIGFIVAAVIILAAQMLLLWTGPASATTTEEDAPERESDGDLEDASLNAEVFTTGANITISGAIDDPVAQPLLGIEVVDPEGSIVARGFPAVTADDTFPYTFEAGERDVLETYGDQPLTVGSNYRVTVTYSHGLSIDELDLEFKYIVTPRSEQQQQTEQAPRDDDNDDDDGFDEDELREDLEEGFGGLL